MDEIVVHRPIVCGFQIRLDVPTRLAQGLTHIFIVALRIISVDTFRGSLSPIVSCGASVLSAVSFSQQSNDSIITHGKPVKIVDFAPKIAKNVTTFETLLGQNLYSASKRVLTRQIDLHDIQNCF